MSPESLRLHKNVLFQALTDAVRNQLLSSNPCQFVQLPQKERKEAHFYSATQMQALFATLQNDPLLPLVKITAIYGLRRSELLGLQWDSIDEERGTLAICHTVVKVTSVAVRKAICRKHQHNAKTPSREITRWRFLTKHVSYVNT